MKSNQMPNELKGFDKHINIIMNEIKDILDQSQSNKHTKLLNAKQGSTRKLDYSVDKGRGSHNN